MPERDRQDDESQGHSRYTQPAKPSEQAVQTFGDTYRRGKTGTQRSDKESDSEPERVMYPDQQFS